MRDNLILSPDKVKKSEEVFDWLGHGFYVWENNKERAFQWAKDKKKKGTINEPSVVGVVYQLDYCLDLTDSESINIIPAYYRLMKKEFDSAGVPLPKNKDTEFDGYKDKVIRELDCAVLEYMHDKIEAQVQNDIKSKGFSDYKCFDTVRGVFTEGGPIYNGAGIQSKNHIQVCIRNLNCIKGFFIPRKKIKFP